MKMTINLLLLTIFTCFQIHVFAQPMLDDIDMERIQQRTIRKYIEYQIEGGMRQFSEIRPSWESGNDLSSFRKKEMTFFLTGDFTDIWQGYVSANPTKSWNGRKISFGLLLLKFPCQIFYDHDLINGVDIGQVYFLRLKLLHGIYNLPVAFEIITVDEQSKIIEFSYIEGNKSIGVQQVRFIDLGNEQTEIIHTSYYKSDSDFRDKYIYPYFHKLIIREFHRNMKRLLKADCDSKQIS